MGFVPGDSALSSRLGPDALYKVALWRDDVGVFDFVDDWDGQDPYNSDFNGLASAFLGVDPVDGLTTVFAFALSSVHWKIRGGLPLPRLVIGVT